MTVESNYAIAIATLSDWFKNLARVYQPMKTNRVRFFPSFEQINGIDMQLLSLFAPASIGRSNYFGIFLRHN